MTREEAIAHGKEQLEVFGGEHREFIEMAIKALEQEPIFDKIRAEIIARDRKVKAVRSDGCYFFTAEEVLEILDTYKAESEVDNGNDD